MHYFLSDSSIDILEKYIAQAVLVGRQVMVAGWKQTRQTQLPCEPACFVSPIALFCARK